MWKILQRIFASSVANAKSSARTTSIPTSAFMSEVEEHLDRHFGMSIERRNPQVPVLRPDQFDRDAASITAARNRLDSKSDWLQ